MNAEQQKQKFDDNNTAVEEILESIRLVKGEDYHIKLMVVYAQMLTARLGHLHNLPTGDIGMKGVACALKSWGHGKDRVGHDLVADASALLAKSIWAL